MTATDIRIMAGYCLLRTEEHKARRDTKSMLEFSNGRFIKVYDTDIGFAYTTSCGHLGYDRDAAVRYIAYQGCGPLSPCCGDERDSSIDRVRLIAEAVKD